MKANEFVKKFGWDKATQTSKLIVKNPNQILIFEDGQEEVSLIDLRILVQSHEVVESFGGIKSAHKAALKENKLGNVIHEGLILMHIRVVESCL